MIDPAHDRGLDADGFVRREGDPSRVQAGFAGLVEAYVEAARSGLGDDLDSVYLYGSIPRGTARPGLSDLDGQVLLRRTPTQHDMAVVAEVERGLGEGHPEVSDVEILLDSRAALVDPADRHDGGFHIRVLCTPFWGPDAGLEVAPHRPDLDLATAVQGDWRGALERLRRQSGLVQETRTQEAALCRGVGRRLSRIAFSWVLPRWGGWTSDPGTMTRVVSRLEPRWAAPMSEAVRLGWGGPQAAAPGPARRLLDGWAVELTARGEALGA